LKHTFWKNHFQIISVLFFPCMIK